MCHMNCRNSLREEHQRDLLKDYFKLRRGIDWVGQQDLRLELPLGQKKMAFISPFQDYPIIPTTFMEAGVTQISKENPILFQKVSKLFRVPLSHNTVEQLQPKQSKNIPLKSQNL